MSAPPARGWKVAVQFVLLVGGWLACASASELDTRWASRVWQVDDGLPAANVSGITQTRDGFLWLATQSGLARFDGAQFEVAPIPAGRPRPIIRVMLCDHAENFWVAESGGQVVRFGDGGTRMFTTTNGLPDVLALQMIETPDHVIWISYADDSLYRITPDNKVVRVTAAEGLNEDGTCCLTLDVHSVLWFAKGLQFGFWTGSHFEKAGTLTERNPQILGARNGGLWFCTPSQLLKLGTNAVPSPVAHFDGDGTRLKPSALFEDFNGRLWIGTASDGLFELEHTNLFKVETSQNKIRTIVRDREGSIWVGTDGGGLNRLMPRAVELHGRDEGLPFETVRSMSEDRDGNLWVVTQDGALTQLPANDWANGGKIENWPGGMAHCVISDHQGAMWFGTYQRGLFRWQDGKFSRFRVQNGLEGLTIRSLLVDHRNDLWIGLETEHMVQRLHDGRFQSFAQPVSSRAVRAMAEDSNGQVWLGTLDGRLLRVDGDKLSEVRQAQADSSYPIRCLSATPDGSIWIGYAVNGVCRLKAGKISHVGQQNGLFDENICALMPDSMGRMWFASDRGIFYASMAQLNDVAEGRTNHVQSIYYGRDAGLPSLQAYYGYWPGAIASQSGDILFPTHSGIVVVHPDRVHPNPVPPNVLIESVAVDGQKISREKSGKISLQPNHRKLEFGFTAPSFVAPEQDRFRYRLAGWTEDWSEVERGQPAIFSRLPPGDYIFQVTACNNCGVWNEKGDALAFIVMPFFWQSWWFRSLTILLFLVIVATLVRQLSLRHVRQVVRRLEQQAALQKERTRIAQDMHDELGARFTQISLLGDLSGKALAEPEKARDYLSQIGQVAQLGVKSLDEIVWAVNPRNDTLPDLLDYTGQYALDFISSAGLQCRLDFPDAPPPREISGDVRHSVFLIIKEVLHNVVKHAQCTRVKIGFQLTETEMLWRIEDDGKGFTESSAGALEDGLRNIRQRAAALGGQAEITSQPGTGTEVTFRIPLGK